MHVAALQKKHGVNIRYQRGSTQNNTNNGSNQTSGEQHGKSKTESSQKPNDSHMSSTQNNPMLTDSPTQIITSGMMVQESGSRSSDTFQNDNTMGGMTHVNSNVQITLQKQIDSENAKKIETKL